MMSCPRCSQSMQVVLYEGVEIESCPGCGGEWFDFDELTHIVKSIEQTFSAREIAAVENLDTNTFTMVDTSGVLACPVCRDQPLDRCQYAGSTRIAIDRCPVCQGVWLDSGEMESVQILTEGWQDRMAEDVATFGGVLTRIGQKTRQSIENATGVSRFGLVNFFLKKILG